MRIGIVLGEIIKEDVGGGATFQSNLLQEICRLNSHHKFYFFIEYDNDEKDLAKHYKCSHEFINLSKPSNHAKSGFFNKNNTDKKTSLDQEIQANKIEFCWFICPSYADINCPYAFTVWDLAHRLLTYFPEVSLSGWKFDDREQFYQKMINKSSYVIIGNNEGAKQVNQFYNYPFERIKTIPMPTPNYVYELKGEENFINKKNLIKNKYLFYPAQFWPHKNHIAILNAFKILLEKNEDFKNFKIVFTGSNKGNEEYIKEKTREIGLENYVNFLGFVSKEQIIALYQNAFALTYPSMFGPDNIPPLEAMALKCPVICSNARGMKEQLKDCALFFNPLDPQEFANAILELYSNAKFREELINKGIELAQKVNSYNYVTEMTKVIDEFALIRQMWSGDKLFTHT